MQTPSSVNPLPFFLIIKNFKRPQMDRLRKGGGNEYNTELGMYYRTFAQSVESVPNSTRKRVHNPRSHSHVVFPPVESRASVFSPRLFVFVTYECYHFRIRVQVVTQKPVRTCRKIQKRLLLYRFVFFPRELSLCDKMRDPSLQFELKKSRPHYLLWSIIIEQRRYCFA